MKRCILIFLPIIVNGILAITNAYLCLMFIPELPSHSDQEIMSKNNVQGAVLSYINWRRLLWASYSCCKKIKHFHRHRYLQVFKENVGDVKSAHFWSTWTDMSTYTIQKIGHFYAVGKYNYVPTVQLHFDLTSGFMITSFAQFCQV